MARLYHAVLLLLAICLVDATNVRRFVHRIKRDAGRTSDDERTCWWQGRTYDANIHEEVTEGDCRQKCIDAGDIDGNCVPELDECMCQDGTEEWRNFFDPIVIAPN